MNENRRYRGAVASTLAGIADVARTVEPVGRLAPTDRIEGRTCLVTGATSGLGFAVACELARRGGRIIATGRGAGAELERRIREEVTAIRESDTAGPAPDVVSEKIDLSSFDSVVAFVDRLAARLAAEDRTIDVAVFNAGVVTSRSRPSADGYDAMLQVNYLSKYLLVRRLLARGCIQPGGVNGAVLPRLIFVSSEAHRSSPDVDTDTFMSVAPYGITGSIRNYGYSKLLLTIFTEELSRRLNVGSSLAASVFTLCPGPVSSGIAREAPALFQPLLRLLFSLFFHSPERAAEPVVFLACSPSMEGTDRVYLHLMQRKEKDPRALDPALGRRLWDASDDLLAHRL